MDDLLARLARALGDKYRVDRELGGGGMSRVFVAEDIELGRKVVLKVLPPDLAAGLSVERFRREIHLAAQLQHPNVVPLHAAGQADGLLYYTMPLVEGESLRTKLAREGEQPVSEAIRILRDVADALAYAHEHGVVHRDIKPDNVLISRHHGLVTDFGVAKALTASSGAAGPAERSTSVGVALGTPAYMAPEQAAADPHADHRVDIYALGVLGYEMLTGRPPFTGPTPQAVLAAHVTQRPEPLTTLRSSVPLALAELIMRCLEKKPADRWQTADEVLQQLERMTTPSGGTTPTLAARAVRRPNSSLLKFALPPIAVAALGIVLWRNHPVEHPSATRSDKVVAVLPFRVTGADPALAYLAEGMVDLLAARLTGEGGPRAVDPRVAISSYRRAVTSEREHSEDAAVTLGARLGAGQVIDGGVVGSPARLVLTASLRRVPSGAVSARASVQGPADSLAMLTDRLAGQLLLIGAGETEQTSGVSISLSALRAYLDGQAAYRQGQYENAITSYQRALRADSTFALAALGLIWASTWGAANSDIETGERLAWSARDRLSPRDRLLLKTEIGPNYPGLSSLADMLAIRELAVKLVPDRAEAWYQLGDLYHHWGALIGVEDSWARAAAAFHRAVELDSTFVSPLVHLVERAAGDRDTSAVRRFGAIALRADSVAGTSDYFRMIMALSLGDTASLRAMRSRFDSMLDRSLSWISFIWQVYGWPLEDAHGALAALRTRASTREDLGFVLLSEYFLALNEGRPKKAQEFRRELLETPGIPSNLLPDPMLDAIYWQADTGAAEDVALRLAHSADAPISRSPPSRVQQYRDICSLEQWRLYHGGTKSTGRAIAKLRAAVEPPDSAETVAFSSQCALMLDSWSATLDRRPDAMRKLASLDSVVSTGPPGWERIQYANLLVGRLYEMQGDLLRANRAARRATSFGLLPVMLSSYLREQGRLAALNGNRPAAIRAYQHYLVLRADPEPSLKGEVTEVKTELARLVGER